MLLMLLLGSAKAAFGQPSAPATTPDPGVPSTQVPSVLSKAAYVQRLNDLLPLNVSFNDEDGKEVRLGQYFGQRSVILAFVYFECPMLCTHVLNRRKRSLCED
jgi:protein SCO1